MNRMNLLGVCPMKKRTAPPYGFVEHTADMGVRFCGKDMDDLFSNAAMVLRDLLVSIDSRDETPAPVAVTLTGEDPADLLVRWLGELLYLFEGDSLVTTRVTMQTLTHVELHATAWTIPFRPERHKRLQDIKAVTFHQAKIIEKDGRLEAVILFDV